MKISNAGVLEIAEHEGIVLGPYRDSVGVWTYGVGHTKAAGGVDPSQMSAEDTRGWSGVRAQEEMITALNLFDTDLDSYEARVNQALTRDVSQPKFDALVSFDFNTGGINRANLTKQINAGDMSGSGFMGWLRPKEIIGRRKAEQALFQTGDYSANGDGIPVYDALGNGRFKYRTKVSGFELAALMKQAGLARKPKAVRVATPAPKPANPFAAFLMAIFGRK